MSKKSILEVLAGAIFGIFVVAVFWVLGAVPAQSYFAPSTIGFSFAYVDTTDYSFNLVCPIPSEVNNLSLYFTRSGIYDDKNVDMYINGNLYDTEYIPIGSGATASGKENTFSTTTPFFCTGSNTVRLMASSTVRLHTWERNAQASSTPPAFTTPYFAKTNGTGYVFGMSQYVVLASSTQSSTGDSSPITVISQGGSYPMVYETNCTITSTSSLCTNAFDDFSVMASISLFFWFIVLATIWIVLQFKLKRRNDFDIN